MQVNEMFELKSKEASTLYKIIQKGVRDVSTNKQGYMCISITEKPELKFFSYAQFHLLKHQHVIEV